MPGLSETEIPTFDLPEWGTRGAPDLADFPDLFTDVSTVVKPEDTAEVRFTISTIDTIPGTENPVTIGAVSGEATVSIENDDLQPAMVRARSQSQELLAQRAQEMGAMGVVGLRFDMASVKKNLLVIASGTAITFDRYSNHPELF